MVMLCRSLAKGKSVGKSLGEVRLYEPSLRDKSDEEAYAIIENKGKVGNVTLRKDCPAIATNSKTGRSFDCTTVCPRQIRGMGCAYCYVNEARVKDFNAKIPCAQTKYTGLHMTKETITHINNKFGGLRIFSFGDYIDTAQCKRNLDGLIKDAKASGLKLKAITKRPDFVEKYHNDIDVINVSVDTLGSGMPWKKARELRGKYPNVLIRNVVLNKEELKEWDNSDIRVDVVTPFHGISKECRVDPSDGLQNKENAKRRKEGENVKDVAVLKDMRPSTHKDIASILSQKYAAKACGLAKEGCEYCAVKCGLRTVAERRKSQVFLPSMEQPTAVDLKMYATPIAMFTRLVKAADQRLPRNQYKVRR